MNVLNFDRFFSLSGWGKERENGKEVLMAGAITV